MKGAEGEGGGRAERWGRGGGGRARSVRGGGEEREGREVRAAGGGKGWGGGKGKERAVWVRGGAGPGRVGCGGAGGGGSAASLTDPTDCGAAVYKVLYRAGRGPTGSSRIPTAPRAHWTGRVTWGGARRGREGMGEDDGGREAGGGGDTGTR